MRFTWVLGKCCLATEVSDSNNKLYLSGNFLRSYSSLVIRRLSVAVYGWRFVSTKGFYVVNPSDVEMELGGSCLF